MVPTALLAALALAGGPSAHAPPHGEGEGEEVSLEELERSDGAPATARAPPPPPLRTPIERAGAPWLAGLPALALAAIAWNADWKRRRNR